MAAQPRSSRASRSKSEIARGEPSRADEFIDPSFEHGGEFGVIVVDRGAPSPSERAGEPLRVCLACGEEEPSWEHRSEGCAHREVGAFAEAPTSAIDAAERVRRAMAELHKAQRALASIARSEASSGGAVIDERPEERANASDEPSEPRPCAVCAERAAFEARDHERSRAKRKKLLRGGDEQGAFAFAAEPRRHEPEAIEAAAPPEASAASAPSAESAESAQLTESPELTESAESIAIEPSELREEHSANEGPRPRAKRKRAAA